MRLVYIFHANEIILLNSGTLSWDIVDMNVGQCGLTDAGDDCTFLPLPPPPFYEACIIS